MSKFIECPDGTLVRKSEIMMVDPSIRKGDDCWYFDIRLDARSSKYTCIGVECSAVKEIAQNQLDLFRKRLQQ